LKPANSGRKSLTPEERKVRIVLSQKKHKEKKALKVLTARRAKQLDEQHGEFREASRIVGQDDEKVR
jgi:hypothetical protein